MAWTQAQLDLLDAEYAKGAKSVSYSDRTVVFHSIEEYLKLRAAMLQDIGSSSTSGRSTFAAPRRD